MQKIEELRFYIVTHPTWNNGLARGLAFCLLALIVCGGAWLVVLALAPLSWLAVVLPWGVGGLVLVAFVLLAALWVQAGRNRQAVES